MLLYIRLVTHMSHGNIWFYTDLPDASGRVGLSLEAGAKYGNQSQQYRVLAVLPTTLVVEKWSKSCPRSGSIRTPTIVKTLSALRLDV